MVLPVTTVSWQVEDSGTRGVGTYATGFEGSEGFVPGPLESGGGIGQNGWGASGTDLAWANINTANPAAGTQHLRVENDTTSAAGTLRLARSQDISPGGGLTSVFTMSQDVNISATGGSDYDLLPGRISGPSFYFALRMKFFYYDYDLDGYPGEIFIADDLDGLGAGAPVFVVTGAEYDPGVYRPVVIDADFNAPGPGGGGQLGDIDYFYNGVLVYNGGRPFPATDGGGIQQWGIIHDNFQNGIDIGADIDNINITPEPATLCLLVLGGVAALRRRR
jgi:hypothetical protein